MQIIFQIIFLPHGWILENSYILYGYKLVTAAKQSELKAEKMLQVV